jgi:hypothetical protein
MVRKSRINVGWSRSSTTPLIIFLVRLFFLAVLVLLFLTEAEGIDISATGGWSETVNETDLISGAGSNLVDTYESNTNASTITISNCIDDQDEWKLNVKRDDTGGWPISLILYVKRTSDGNGQGSVSGGLSYIEITTTDNQFFSGAGDRAGINLQYKLSGMSVGVTPANYNTTITFTVVDIP